MKTNLVWVLIFLLTISGFSQSGGQFAISQSVTAGGGGDSGGGNFALIEHS